MISFSNIKAVKGTLISAEKQERIILYDKRWEMYNAKYSYWKTKENQLSETCNGN